MKILSNSNFDTIEYLIWIITGGLIFKLENKDYIKYVNRQHRLGYKSEYESQRPAVNEVPKEAQEARASA